MSSDEKSVSALIAASRGGAGGGADAQNSSSTQSAPAPDASEQRAYGNALPKDIGDLVYGLAARARDAYDGGDASALNRWEQAAVIETMRLPLLPCVLWGIGNYYSLRLLRKATYMSRRTLYGLYGATNMGIIGGLLRSKRLNVQNDFFFMRQSTIGFQARTIMRAEYPNHPIIRQFDQVNPGYDRVLRLEKDRRDLPLDSFKVDQVLYELNELHPSRTIDLDDPRFDVDDVRFYEEAKARQKNRAPDRDYEEFLKSLQTQSK